LAFDQFLGRKSESLAIGGRLVHHLGVIEGLRAASSDRSWRISCARSVGSIFGSVTLLTNELWGKRVELISELVPDRRHLEVVTRL
jgi:hypothetical protein